MLSATQYPLSPSSGLRGQGLGKGGSPLFIQTKTLPLNNTKHPQMINPDFYKISEQIATRRDEAVRAAFYQDDLPATSQRKQHCCCGFSPLRACIGYVVNRRAKKAFEDEFKSWVNNTTKSISKLNINYRNYEWVANIVKQHYKKEAPSIIRRLTRGELVSYTDEYVKHEILVALAAFDHKPTDSDLGTRSGAVLVKPQAGTDHEAITGEHSAPERKYSDEYHIPGMAY